MAQTLAFRFHIPPSVAEFAVTKAAYRAAHPRAPFGYIAMSSLVLHVDTRTTSAPRVLLLLLQRAPSDDDPNLWEPPSGACEDDDESIIQAAARELWEESGPYVTRICRLVGDPHFFTLDDGKKVCQFNFLAHVKSGRGTFPAVKLNPEEHRPFIWASESEVKARKAKGLYLDFTIGKVERTVLLAFCHS
jgi:8-oxo-dGTP pyrophosphatase MutT (NUDIX family)